MPGSCMVLEAETSGVSSTWFLRKAADARPRSCVCLKYVGSFWAKDAAMSLRDGSAGSSVSTGGRGKVRTAAKPDSGL